MSAKSGWVLLVAVGVVLSLAAGSSSAGKAGASAIASVSDAGFVLCEGVYALCTTALCAPVAGQEGLLSCKCSVQDGYSAGHVCNGPKDTPAGKMIYSRYHPIRSYVACNNSRPWAWCLDVPCLIDADNPLQATATCSCKVTSSPQSTYVAVTDFYSEAACATGIISSASVPDVDGITRFFYSKRPPPHPIKVLTKP
jgi:hypothetical protein